MHYCELGNFREGFVFEMRSFAKINLWEMVKSLCRSLMYVNHALVANLNVPKSICLLLRFAKNTLLAKKFEFLVL